MLRYGIRFSGLGQVLVASGGRGVCAVLLGDTEEEVLREARGLFPSMERDNLFDDHRGTVEAVGDLVDGRLSSHSIEVDMRGTPFQVSVWKALQEVPAGKTVTYGELAERIGSPGAARAVAQACGANTLAVVVPCHRAVGAGGAVSGYRWGEARKRLLLHREGAL